MQDTATTIIRQYGIKGILDNMTKGAALDARKELPQVLGVGESRFYKILYATEDNPTDISVQQAMAMAKYFGVSIDDIMRPYEDPHARI